MFFNEFIAERGSPFRTNDLWDDLYCALLDQLYAEIQDPKMAMIFILVCSAFSIKIEFVFVCIAFLQFLF